MSITLTVFTTVKTAGHTTFTTFATFADLSVQSSSSRYHDDHDQRNYHDLHDLTTASKNRKNIFSQWCKNMCLKNKLPFLIKYKHIEGKFRKEFRGVWKVRKIETIETASVLGTGRTGFGNRETVKSGSDSGVKYKIN